MSSTALYPVAYTAGQPRAQYGLDNPIVTRLFQQIGDSTASVQVTEVFCDDKTRVDSKMYTDANALDTHLYQEPQGNLAIRILTVTQLSVPVIQLLGCKYDMDYELWTNRVQSSDREWFAGPLHHRGAREFSHFNLTCVDFQRATLATPQEYRDNRKLSHTVRLVRLLDTKRSDRTSPRLFVIRRIAGHLRRDGNLWTFIYFCDPFVDISAAKYINDVPGNAQLPLASWLSDYIDKTTPNELINDLSRDGFGFVLRVLREIKTTWKLLLHEMEVFLEVLNEESTDEELMDSATWLHRRFLLNIDYFQRQLRYHRRYVTYLTNAPLQKGLCIVPDIFKTDLLQENNALIVAEERLKALRDQTVGVLETVLNLNTIKHARIAAEMTRLQRQDAAITIAQGQTLQRLTMLNMFYLPPTFIATIYGMNTAHYADGSSWTLKSFLYTAVVFTILTMILAAFKPWKRNSVSNSGRLQKAKRFLFCWFGSKGSTESGSDDVPLHTV